MSQADLQRRLRQGYMVVHRGGFHGHVDEELAGLQGDDSGLGLFLDDCPLWLGQIGLTPLPPQSSREAPVHCRQYFLGASSVTA